MIGPHGCQVRNEKRKSNFLSSYKNVSGKESKQQSTYRDCLLQCVDVMHMYVMVVVNKGKPTRFSVCVCLCVCVSVRACAFEWRVRLRELTS